MIILKTAEDLEDYLKNKRSEGNSLGFVPTMGALHQGHLSLISQSLQETDTTICSIFVNPTQFNDPKDFQKYPVTIEKDIELLQTAGTHVLFLPSVDVIYPEGTEKLRQYQLGELETILEGKFRPGHFQGVCQVMDRLLTLVQPDDLYMGSKDYQQCMVVAKLIQITGILSHLHACPTLRESDGLAMSSRNIRLSPEERLKAAAIYKTLSYMREDLQPGSQQVLKLTARQMLENEGFKVDYVEIADAQTLVLTDNWDGISEITALVAAFMGEVRLIDNMQISR